MLKRLIMLAVMMPLVSTGVAAIEYRCPVESKRNSEKEYTSEEIAKWKFEVQVVEDGDAAWLQRCSQSIVDDAFTCDEYEVDYIAYDTHVGIKKLYHFQGQFDVQIFSNLSFLENNGRGGLAWGKCEIVAP